MVVEVATAVVTVEVEGVVEAEIAEAEIAEA